MSNFDVSWVMWCPKCKVQVVNPTGPFHAKCGFRLVEDK